jgi:excisionase family DNA binding protein
MARHVILSIVSHASHILHAPYSSATTYGAGTGLPKGIFMDAKSYYLKPKVVAERLSLSDSQVYRLIEKGEIPSVRIGQGSVRVPAGALEAYIEARTTGKVEPKRVSLNQLPSDREELAEIANAFEERAGHDPFDFVLKWRAGEIEDTAENARRAIDALALRASLIDAGMAPVTA